MTTLTQSTLHSSALALLLAIGSHTVSAQTEPTQDQAASESNSAAVPLDNTAPAKAVIAPTAPLDSPSVPASNAANTDPSTSSELIPTAIEPVNSATQTEVASDPVLAEQASAIEAKQILEPSGPVLMPLHLLGTTVQPNQATLLQWEFEATFVDASAQVPVLVVNGANPGPTLCLTAAVHGDELNGIEMVRRVIHSVDPEKLSGALIGVPIVNLQGFQRANRYLPDRRDLNRYFPGHVKGSYASRIAYSFFTQVVQHCDFLVDIHTGSLSRTNLPQIRANLLIPEVAALAEKMGSIVVLQSKGGSGTLRRATTDLGIPAVTLEAGAPNNLQKEAVESGVKSIMSAIDSLGMTTPKPFWKRSEEPVFYQSTWIRARKGGILFSKVELGDSVRKGNVLGLLSDPITNKTTKIIAPFDGRVIGMALNQVMYQGFAAYHIGLKSSIVEAAQPPELVPEDISLETSNETSAPSELASPANDAEQLIDETVPNNSDNPVLEPESKPNPIEDMALPTADPDE
ncbi:succinylglutamate desuccinylase/aspartoacylase family protein [Arenicella xantha]|uniref:Succinylglutamate desuccinylase/Aspartoacylase catalytic domain-containing protein n=1 Tax=Arenicella xantha TaxID=644221 RepID=A0A395JLT0_9GAMM|nr:succinylglutamate desuccinylase/aspartoacylase family protein [Arenicella xantha]RBP51743.1 hypothetical protein DFR28_1021176 [Arenicella xantha]